MRPMLGYYFAGQGDRWPGDPTETDERTDIDVFLWRQFDLAGARSGLVGLRKAARRAVSLRRPILLGLDMGYGPWSWKEQIKAVRRRFWMFPKRDPWDSVAAIDVADEPTRREAAIHARKVREFLCAEGMRVPPLGATFSYRLEGADNDATRELDWIGLEAYLDPSQQDEDVGTAIRKSLAAQAGRLLVPRQRAVVVLQAYDRNGAWKNHGTLATLQYAGWRAAREILAGRLLAVTMFSWMRPGGTYYLPATVKGSHAVIWAEINGRR